jgi:hypothetical protein
VKQPVPTQHVVESPAPVKQADAPVKTPVPAVQKSAPVQEEEDEDEDFPEIVEDIPLGRCRHIMVAGKSKGKPCGASAKENGLCTKHKKSTNQAPPPTAPTTTPTTTPITTLPQEESPIVAKEKSVPTPPKKSIEPTVEFIKLTSREEEKRIEFRVKTREYLLNNKVYPPLEVEECKEFTLVKNTRVVVNKEKTSVLGYLSEKDELIRQPNPATDKVVLDFGIQFDVSHISESDIDE